jgi:hypothetical protein
MRLPTNRDPKPASADSWWLKLPREGFSQFAVELFSKQHDAMAGIGPGQPWIKPEQMAQKRLTYKDLIAIPEGN